MLNVGPLADRVMGKFPLSIATSLAIEGAKGEHELHPTGKNELIEYDEIWVNIKTMFRNMYNAVSREDVLTIKPSDFYEQIEIELDQFERVIQSETNGRMKVVFYVSDYAGMEMKYSLAHLRGDTTPLQRAYTAAMIGALGPYVRNHKETLKSYRLQMKDGTVEKALMLTHFAFDLTTKHMPRMALLESHTGAVKQKHQWYTKYHNGKDLPMIPFCLPFLQVFGDSEHFRPMSIAARKSLIELATQRNWSQVTTREKLMYDIDSMKDHFFRDILKRLFHS